MKKKMLTTNKNGYRVSKRIVAIAAGAIGLFFARQTMAQAPVTITEVDQTIPTYLSGPPDPNPMFFFGKQSQGAEGRIYPYPLYDNLTNTKGEKSYHLVYLENEYVKIGILPEIGGRIFSALDKTDNYDFIYNQHVVKPALIGLIGAWISGGLEWNIPHHHRASTFMPVQWSREDNPDGSKTVWVGELEMRERMSWAVGYTLRPGSSVIECSVRIINRTPLANSMLCFANIAVHTNLNYQVIFPPRTQMATGHSKRQFFSWPVVDSADMSYYKNNKNSASWFAVNHYDDFVAGYDHGVNAGTMAIANHHIVPGKKFFTWGVGNIWDNILTDSDGPYLEMMVGAYSDNQPDYSWMQPYEERSFTISLFPFKGIDGVKNSNLDAAVNLNVKDGKAILGFYTTKAYKNATVTLTAKGKTIIKEDISIDPATPYNKEISLPTGLDQHDLRASITVDGKELVAYTPVNLQPVKKPLPTQPPLKPEEIKNTEELFLAGQRIDQFHNPELDADPYWQEVLKRDSGNVNANTGMGRLCLQRAEFITAEKYFNKAIDRLTFQFTTPKNAEPLYYLGVALKAQGRNDEAFDAFYKAAWSQEWKSPAYFSLAEIDAAKGKFQDALDLVNQSLDANAMNIRAYGLKAAILRHLDRTDEALNTLAAVKDKTDPLDVRFMAEKWLASKDSKDGDVLFTTLSENPATAQEIAAEYYNAGLWDDGEKVLSKAVGKDLTNPIVYYYLGYFSEKLGNNDKAADYRHKAAEQSPAYVFPFQYEAITVLKSAIDANAKDAHALYYLGNLLYDWQPKEAVAYWQRSADIDPDFAITWRNLAIANAYAKDKTDASRAKAITELEKAVSIGSPYSTHLAELDRLYQAEGTPVQKRLDLLEKNKSVAVKNDEALGSLINLDTFTGNTGEAINLLQGRTFSIWEGGSIFNTGQAWADAYLVQGLQLYNAKKYQEALSDFDTALKPAESLRAEQRHDLHNTQIIYWIGCTYDALGQKDRAKAEWNKIISANLLANGAGGSAYRASSNLGKQEQDYFKALAKKKLEASTNNTAEFNQLVSDGKAKSNLTEKPVQWGQQALERRSAHESTATAHYIAGLGYTGLGNKAKARDEFNTALGLSPDFLPAKVALGQL